MEGYSIIKKFRTEAEAQELASFFKTKNINSKIKNNIQNFDVTFANDTINNSYFVYVAEHDFANAKNCLLHYSEQLVQSISNEHYLFQFTNDELIDVLINAHEWNEVDVLLAEKILKDRRVEYSLDQINEERKAQIKELEVQKKLNNWTKTWVILVLLTLPLIGVIIGTIFWTKSVQLPDGRKHLVYDTNSRKFGRIVVIIGAVLTALIILIRIISFSSLH